MILNYTKLIRFLLLPVSFCKSAGKSRDTRSIQNMNDPTTILYLPFIIFFTILFAALPGDILFFCKKRISLSLLSLLICLLFFIIPVSISSKIISHFFHTYETWINV